jgi:hypothetical protein
MFEVRSFRGADCDTDLYLMAAKVRAETVSVQTTIAEDWYWRFHLKKLNDVEIKEQILTEHHTMKSYWGSGGIVNAFLTSELVGGVISFTIRPLYPQGKGPWYLLDRSLGGTYRRSGRGGEEKNLQPLPGLEPPIIQSVAQRYDTELFGSSR